MSKPFHVDATTASVTRSAACAQKLIGAPGDGSSSHPPKERTKFKEGSNNFLKIQTILHQMKGRTHLNVKFATKTSEANKDYVDIFIAFIMNRKEKTNVIFVKKVSFYKDRNLPI